MTIPKIKMCNVRHRSIFVRFYARKEPSGKPKGFAKFGCAGICISTNVDQLSELILRMTSPLEVVGVRGPSVGVKLVLLSSFGCFHHEEISSTMLDHPSLNLTAHNIPHTACADLRSYHCSLLLDLLVKYTSRF